MQNRKCGFRLGELSQNGKGLRPSFNLPKLDFAKSFFRFCKPKKPVFQRVRKSEKKFRRVRDLLPGFRPRKKRPMVRRKKIKCMRVRRSERAAPGGPARPQEKSLKTAIKNGVPSMLPRLGACHGTLSGEKCDTLYGFKMHRYLKIT